MAPANLPSLLPTIDKPINGKSDKERKAVDLTDTVPVDNDGTTEDHYEQLLPPTWKFLSGDLKPLRRCRSTSNAAPIERHRREESDSTLIGSKDAHTRVISPTTDLAAIERKHAAETDQLKADLEEETRRKFAAEERANSLEAAKNAALMDVSSKESLLQQASVQSKETSSLVSILENSNAELEDLVDTNNSLLKEPDDLSTQLKQSEQGLNDELSKAKESDKMPEMIQLRAKCDEQESMLKSAFEESSQADRRITELRQRVDIHADRSAKDRSWYYANFEYMNSLAAALEDQPVKTAEFDNILQLKDANYHALEERASACAKALKELEDKSELNGQSSSRRIQELEADLEGRTKAFDALSEKNKAVEEAHVKLLEETKSQLSDDEIVKIIDRHYGIVQNDNREMALGLDRLFTRLSKDERELLHQDLEIDSLKATIKNHDQQTSTLQKDINAKESRLMTLEIEMTALPIHHKREIDQRDTIISALNDQLKTSEGKMSNFETLTADDRILSIFIAKDGDLSRLQAREKELVASNTELEKQQKKLDEWAKEDEKLSAHHEEAMNNLQARLTHAEEEASGLKTQLELENANHANALRHLKSGSNLDRLSNVLAQNVDLGFKLKDFKEQLQELQQDNQTIRESIGPLVQLGRDLWDRVILLENLLFTAGLDFSDDGRDELIQRLELAIEVAETATAGPDTENADEESAESVDDDADDEHDTTSEASSPSNDQPLQTAPSTECNGFRVSLYDSSVDDEDEPTLRARDFQKATTPSTAQSGEGPAPAVGQDATQRPQPAPVDHLLTRWDQNMDVLASSLRQMKTELSDSSMIFRIRPLMYSLQVGPHLK